MNHLASELGRESLPGRLQRSAPTAIVCGLGMVVAAATAFALHPAPTVEKIAAGPLVVVESHCERDASPPPEAEEPPPAPPCEPEPEHEEHTPDAAPDSFSIEVAMTMYGEWFVPRGFPGLSPDGRLVASTGREGDGGRGNPNLTVLISRASDGKIVRRFPILDADEVDDQGESHALGIETSAVRARIAKVLRYLEHGRYRPAHPLTESLELEPPAIESRGLVVEAPGDRVQVFDAATGWVLMQARFTAASAWNLPDEGDSGCVNDEVADKRLWLSPDKDAVLVQVTYRAGPCYCDDTYRYYVRELSPPPLD